MAVERCVNLFKFLSFCGKLVPGELFIYMVEKTALQVLGEFLWRGSRLEQRLKACPPGNINKGKGTRESNSRDVIGWRTMRQFWL